MNASPRGNRNRQRLSSFLSKGGGGNSVCADSPGNLSQKRRVSSFLGTFLQRQGSVCSSDYDADDSRSGTGSRSSSFLRSGNIVVELNSSNFDDHSESVVGGSGSGIDAKLNGSFHSLMTSPTVDTSSSTISHPPTSSRQSRLRKLDGGGDGGNGSSCRRMSLRQAMLQRYNKHTSSSSSIPSGIRRRRSSSIKHLPFGDDDSTVATAEPSSMDFSIAGGSSHSPLQSPPMSPAASPAPSTSSGCAGPADETPISPELKKEMDEMDDVMRILKDKLGFQPVAIVGSRNASLPSLPPLPMSSPPASKTSRKASSLRSSASPLPTISSDDGASTNTDDDLEESCEDTTQPTNTGGNDDEEIDDDLKKEIEEMESIMSTMKAVLGFRPVAVVGSQHESFTLPSSQAMARAARRTPRTIAQ